VIRINLLPTQEKKPRKQIRMPAVSSTWPVAAGIIYVVALLGLGFMQHQRIQSLEGKIAEAKEESEKLAPQLAKIKQLTHERQEVNKRLDIIRSLDRTRYFRVKAMNDVSLKLPRNIWLTEFKESSATSCEISGVAFNNFSIADFMRNLEESDLFNQVNLTFAERGVIEDHEVMSFQVSSQMIPQ
jgi:type IV pilus assembly protein PilN